MVAGVTPTAERDPIEAPAEVAQLLRNVEATTGIEPVYAVLQTAP